MDSLEELSMENEECLIDNLFTSEEIAAAIKSLKSQKAAGPNGIVAEHLKEVVKQLPFGSKE